MNAFTFNFSLILIYIILVSSVPLCLLDLGGTPLYAFVLTDQMKSLPETYDAIVKEKKKAKRGIVLTHTNRRLYFSCQPTNVEDFIRKEGRAARPNILFILHQSLSLSNGRFRFSHSL